MNQPIRSMSDAVSSQCDYVMFSFEKND